MRTGIGVLCLTLGLATAASAADLGRMPVKAPPPPAPAIYSWSGLYIGGHIGWGWNDNSWTDPTAAFAGIGDVDGDGFLGGGQVGFNWHWSNIVLGIEAQFSGTNMDGSTTFGTPGVAALTLSNDVNWLTSVTGRLGITPGPAWLLYVKGGGAWADFDTSATVDIGGVLATSSVSDDRFGWTVGAGTEWGFAPNWSAFAEYQYYDFGSETYAFFPAAIPAEVDTQIHTVKVGINYRLGGLFR